MGGDGGTIPKRKDRVKTKSRSELKSKHNVEGERDPAERWKVCPISGLSIRKPVMAGQWGHILSKEGVIEYLLKKRASTSESYQTLEEVSPVCDAVHKMSDVIELRLKDNAALATSNIPSEEKSQMGNFVCPITGLETNGKYKFVFSWKCGCVVSERALKQCDEGPKTEFKKCLVCEKAYDAYDLVLINPITQEELEENQMKSMSRKMIPSYRTTSSVSQPKDDTNSNDHSSTTGSSFRGSSRPSSRTNSECKSQKSSSSARHRSSSSPTLMNPPSSTSSSSEKQRRYYTSSKDSRSSLSMMRHSHSTSAHHGDRSSASSSSKRRPNSPNQSNNSKRNKL